MMEVEAGKGNNMPKRTDIETILVIGSGPIVIGQAENLTMQEHKHVFH